MIDYKSEIHLKDDKDNAEFIADVTSFANTLGRYLIIGIKENQGVPSEIKGISQIQINNASNSNPDQWKQVLDTILRTKVDPRLPHYEIKIITLSSGNKVIAIEIPQSWISPHRNGYKYFPSYPRFNFNE